MHHAVNLLVVGPHIQPENRPSLVHAFHIKSQQLRRAAFFHSPPHEFRDAFLFSRHFLGHRVLPLSTVALRAFLALNNQYRFLFLLTTEDCALKTQYAVSPPSSGIAAPVSHDDSSDARNIAISATSAGLPMRPRGIVAIRAFRSACPCSLSLNTPFTSSVSTIEGQMQFTRIFSCAWSMAMAFVSIVTPPFEAQYAARSFTATSPSTEPIFTMAPPPHFRNSASTARDIRNGPFTFTVITRSHSSSLIPSTVETCSVPALFTSTFSRPNRSTVPFTARSTSRARVASHSIANPVPPCF